MFELFARRLPGGRRFGVVAGTGLLQEVRDFRFGDDELRYLRDHAVVGETVAYLENYRFTGSIRGYREGELYSGSPIEGNFAERSCSDPLLIAILNYDSAVATCRHRYRRPPARRGWGRVAGERSAVAAARAAYIAGTAQ